VNIFSIKIKRIPPPIVTFIFGCLMYFFSYFVPLRMEILYQMGVIIIMLLMASVILIHTVSQFFRQKTTVNPLSPEKANSLVTDGLYQVSRNPMYLAMALLLSAWALYMENPLNLVFIAGFIYYMNRFQIRAEEEALEKLFGEDYRTYKQRVRRWI
jgi:protein-S-isoprenylcysteine O-methyltransferase Ste14